MCFGLKDKRLSGDAPPARISSPLPQSNEKTSKPPQADIVSTHSKESSQPLAPKTKKAKEDWKNDEYGESVSMALHMKTQKRIKELYPDGLPADMKNANGKGMSQGNIGGPLGGGAGMAMGL